MCDVIKQLFINLTSIFMTGFYSILNSQLQPLLVVELVEFLLEFKSC